MPKISVIIPVYNVEKYIEQCINSLLNQTLKDCEFIFVNDGSRDNSKEIIEKYKALDDRIILINQENQGVSIARNNGLNVAKGEYVGFVDADDYIELDMLYILYNSSINNNTDLVICNYEYSLDGHTCISNLNIPINKLLNKDYIDNNLIHEFIRSDKLNSIWNKLYKNSIINDYKINFPQKVALGEDSIFNLKYISKIKNLVYTPYVGYHYREVEGSATRNILNKDYFKRSLDVYKTDFKTIYDINIDYKTEYKLKSIKLITSVISYIYIYLTSNDINLKYKYQYVSNMIRNNDVQSALHIYIAERYEKLSRYEKFIVNMIKQKSTIGLYIATTYSRLSRLRNQ